MNTEKITQPFTEKFPGDFSGNGMQRQTPDVLFSTVSPEEFPKPELIVFNQNLLAEIGLGKYEPKDLPFLAAQNLPENITPYATAYAGHQFGNWAGQLGDGRAIFAGEIENNFGKKTEIQWKGAGATPYSRHADGRAVLRSSLREYLMSEAMHHLHVPTSRALSLCFTGEDVVRDILYSGHPKPEKGAVVVRTAESFLRFGHFEFLSSAKNYDSLKKLADDTIKNYFPEIQENHPGKYTEWFQKISERTADLMVEWFRIGFVHGVMNTDNMSALGLTIDYGPFSMMDEYDLAFTPNTTDLPGRRYAFGEQGKIAQWNLWQLGNALFPLIKDEKSLEEILNNFGDYFWQKHDQMLANKFGFENLKPSDEDFFVEWQHVLQDLKLDYTLFFSYLEKYSENISCSLQNISYKNLTPEELQRAENFLQKYVARLSENNIPREESLKIMQENNPKFILRNYLLFECIAEVETRNYTLLNKIITALQRPYEEIFPEFSVKRPEKYNGKPGASMLSCSS